MIGFFGIRLRKISYTGVAAMRAFFEPGEKKSEIGRGFADKAKESGYMQYKLFTTPMCPKCPAMKEHMAGQSKISGEIINCHTPEGLAEARKLVISSVPTVVFFDDDGKESRRCGTKEEVDEVMRSM